MVVTTHAFLRQHREEIVRAWAERAREEPGGPEPHRLPLEPRIRPLLDALAGWLEEDALARPAPDLAEVCAAEPTPDLAWLDAVVRELALLRGTVLRLLLAADAPAGDPGAAAARRAEIGRLSQGFDAAIREAVLGFARARERRITELTARQDVLRGADVRYRTLVQLSPDAVLVVRRARLTFANPAALALVGRPADDLLGRSIFEVVHADDHEALRAGWSRMVEDPRSPQRGEVRIVRPCGEVRTVEAAAAASRDLRGDAIQLVLRDVTERRRAEDALRAWLEAIPALAFHCDAVGGVLDCNRRWLEFTGQSREEVRGLGWMDAVHHDDLEGIARAVRRAMETQGLYECEYRLRRADGAFRWMLARATPLRDAGGRVTGWMGIGTDIEEHRRMEESLRDSDRRKSEFLGILSHELRNPLAPIRTAAALLRRVAPGSAEASWAADVIARQAAHLTRLVDDLLDTTRISHGKLELRRTRVDLCAIVRRTAEDLGCLFGDARVALRIGVPDGPVPVDADEARIAQALGNLLHNAAKFTPAGGEVEVTLAAAAGRAELAVRDTGPGMDPGEIERLFAPFAQGDAGLARERGGLGLGLALARDLVERHGGRLSASSAGRGRGARFVISLPLAAAAAEPRPPPAAPAPSRCRTILVIDDSRDAADSLAQLLALEGHRVHVARDGRTGLALAREVHPDLVLCDIALPDLSGYEVARALREQGLPAGARLVALTGYAQPEDVRRAQEAGFDQHLPKPLPIDRLDALLAG